MARKKKSSKLLFWAVFGVVSTTLFVVAIFLATSGHEIFGYFGLNKDQASIKKPPLEIHEVLKQSQSSGKSAHETRPGNNSYHIPILMFHYVEHVKDRADKIRISLNTTPETLDAEISTLINAGYSFITMSEMADILDGKKTIPQKPIVLSFDDGYRDFYTDAFPIIKKYHVKAVVYIISGFVNRPDNLTDSQLKEILKSGLVEIGAHTVHHLALAKIPIERAKTEIVDSKIQLEKEFGVTITAFAYPYGSFNTQTTQLVKDAGFRTAVSTVIGSSVSSTGRFVINRIRPGGRVNQSLLTLLTKVK